MVLADSSQIVPDARLVDRINRGEAEAYGLLVDRYELAVRAVVLPLLADRHAAEDVMQDVFLRAYLKMGALRDGSRFAPWLLKIARREAVQTSRRSRRHRGLPGTDAAEPAVPHGNGRMLDEDKEHLLWHLQRLPKHEQVVVVLRYFNGHTVQEIADMTGRPVGTVTKQLSRGIERMRDTITRENAHERS